MSIAPSGFRPTLEDIEEENSLPCVPPDGRRRPFRVRGAARARLQGGLVAPGVKTDLRPEKRHRRSGEAPPSPCSWFQDAARRHVDSTAPGRTPPGPRPAATRP